MAVETPVTIIRRPQRRRTSNHSALALAALTAGTATASLVLPLGIIGLIACACVMGIAASKARTPFLTKLLAANARRARRVARERALPVGTSGRATLDELTHLVDEIGAQEPSLQHRFDLDALLDRHVTLALAYDRALAAVRIADGSQLEAMRDALRHDSGASAMRLELCERRVQCHRQCEAQAEALADDLAVVADLIRLIAQRVACPDLLWQDDIVARQLAELDDRDCVHTQLLLEMPRAS